MEIKDIKKVEDQLKEEIDIMGKSPDRDAMAQERCVPIIKQELELIILKSVQNLYYLIKANPIVNLKTLKTNKLRELNTIEDYQYNLSLISKLVNEPKNEIAIFIGEIKRFVDNAVYVLQMSNLKSDSAYVRTIAKTLPTMNSNLAKAGLNIKSFDKYGDGYGDIYRSVVEFFSSSVELVQGFARDYLADIKKKKQEDSEKLQEINKSSKISKPVVTSKQLSARQMLIKEANDKYEEFCLDFMRDLEKQYAFSSKDLYEEFINVRFKKFVERYPMPVSDSASEGYAREVLNQINILINHVSKISENSYVTSVYKVKE